MEMRLPLIARLTLVALGSTGSAKVRRPLDPVAAYLLRQDPTLIPPEDAVAAFTTIRARTDVLDEMLLEEAHRARQNGSKIALWTLGGGFDARWYRLLPQISDVVTTCHEVETPDLMRSKMEALDASPYDELWSRVELRSAKVEDWKVDPVEGCEPLLLMEGLAGRMTPRMLRNLLASLATQVPNARVLLGLPAHGTEPGTWTERRLSRLGWRVDAEVRLAPRGRLVGKDGKEICTGMHGMRVLRLVGR